MVLEVGNLEPEFHEDGNEGLKNLFRVSKHSARVPMTAICSSERPHHGITAASYPAGMSRQHIFLVDSMLSHDIIGSPCRAHKEICSL